MTLMNRSTALLLFAAAAAAAAAAAGCRESIPPKLTVVASQGKLLHKGKPAEGARVILVPVTDDSPDGFKPRAVVGNDGAFKIGTYGPDDGAPPGEYRVSVRWPGQRLKVAEDEDEPGPAGPPGGVQPDRLGEKYSDPKASGLTLTVTAEGLVQPAVIDLK